MAIVTSNRTASEITSTETVEFAVPNGFRYHQFDFGTATSGTIAVNVNYGTGAKTIATYDFASSTEPIIIFGDISAIEAVPTSVNTAYTVVYITEMV